MVLGRLNEFIFVMCRGTVFPVHGPLWSRAVLCCLLSWLALVFIEAQNTFLKLVVMGRREPWAGFLLKYSLGSLYLFINCPLTWEKEWKNKVIIIVLLVVIVL